MKPIQEYTKQEKLAAISEYNPCRTERNAVLRYLLAVRRDDADEIAYFEGFGDSVHHMLPIVERIELDVQNTIHIGQSIDGTYAVAVDWSTGTAGGGSHPSVWDEPIADYKEAVRNGIGQLERQYAYAMQHSSDSCNYNVKKIRKLIAKLVEVKQRYLKPKQLSLFEIA